MDKFFCVSDFQAVAASKLIPGVWAYISGGADEEFVMSQNTKAFQRYAIRPKFLRNVSYRDLSVEVLGKRVPFPVGVAPTAMQKAVHPDGEIASVRGAGKAGSIFILSTLSTSSIEEVAAAAKKYNTRIWFQLYFQENEALNIDFLNRAEKAGFEAVVLTVDTQTIGKRRGQLRTPFKLPTNVSLANFGPVVFSDFNSDDAVAGMWDNSKPLRNTEITWDVVDWIRAHTKMKLIIKGLLTAEDARLAVEKGVDAIIVSNHGGRQLDCTLPPIDALPEVVAAVRGRCEVYMDGGINLGSHIFKALALGAKMVFIGRGVLWGLAAGGEEGVVKVLDMLREELDSTMALSGVSKATDINSSLIQQYSPL